MFFLHSVPFSSLASLLGVRTRGALLVKYKNSRRVAVRFKRNYVFTFFFLQELKICNSHLRGHHFLPLKDRVMGMGKMFSLYFFLFG